MDKKTEDLDALLQTHADRLQDIYNNRTAGDYTFLGALRIFIDDYTMMTK